MPKPLDLIMLRFQFQFNQLMPNHPALKGGMKLAEGFALVRREPFMSGAADEVRVGPDETLRLKNRPVDLRVKIPPQLR